MNILITGGAGFIGQKTCSKLIELGHKVVVLDNLSEQIHGEDKVSVKKTIEGIFIEGDIRNNHDLKKAFDYEIEAIYHFAAETGTGQSMYEISNYTDVNVQGTANLLNFIQNNRIDTLKKIILSSSRAVYGEGAYLCKIHGEVYPEERLEENLSLGDFETKCPICGENLELISTSEDAPFQPTSIYGLTKQVQEQLISLFIKNMNIDGYILRYQNVYGPGQSLVNPYTGILAVFSNLAREGQQINIFEDGLESRDFVYIDEVVKANIICLEKKSGLSGIFNIGTGKSTDVNQVASEINDYFGSKSELNLSGMFRVGDIRHNKASIEKALNMLDFRAVIDFEIGLEKFLDWASSQEINGNNSYLESLNELKEKGLFNESIRKDKI